MKEAKYVLRNKYESGIDILKVLCMYYIVILHILGHGGGDK